MQEQPQEVRGWGCDSYSDAGRQAKAKEPRGHVVAGRTGSEQATVRTPPTPARSG